MPRGRHIIMLVLTGVALASTAFAEPFPEDWQGRWSLVQGEAETTVLPDGSLEIDPPPSGHAYWVGGEQMRDYAVSARVKFLRADDKYSGFSLFMRWGGDVWTERDAYWVYLRPMYRSLYITKMSGGKIDDAFDDGVEAKRPEAVPLNEWLDLRVEVRGREVRVYLNDELHIAAVDDTRFPILSGRVGFGAGNAHVIVADLQQTSLEDAQKLPVASYRYVNPPTRGDENRTVLTDGEVNPREEQAFWRMLGDTPEIVFDLGAAYFITRAALMAVSSPAVNIASADILGSNDGEDWHALASLRNEDTRRADAEHTIAGEVRGIARYVKLVLSRPAADQDVELAEVEFFGRPPTDEDRLAADAVEYDTGPEMPPSTGAASEDDAYWYLQSEIARFAIDKSHGLVGGVWSLAHDMKCMERVSDGYYLYTRDGDTETDEYADEVVSSERDGDALVLRCRNADLPQIVIEKRYTLSPDGRRLIKRVGWTNTSDAPDRFLTHQAKGIATEDFRSGGVYMGNDRGLGARLFADDVTMPRQYTALGARNAKVVLLHRYDLGWGVGQFRHQVNDQWCRPLTSRYHERENHPPIYLPNGWEFGVATLHLAPGEQQSTEVQFALYDGRQIDFYDIWRHLPETEAVYDPVERPDWHLDLKSSAKHAPYELSDDPGPALMTVDRTLAAVETGDLWYLAQIHGVWGEWYADGIVESGAGARIDTQWLKDLIVEAHAMSPRMKLGVYTWAWAAHPRSDVCQQHPEWFITHDRTGQVFNAYSNMVLNHLRRMGVAASMDELMGQFEAVIREFGGDYFYLDGGGGGANLIDWEHLGIDQDYHYEELYRRIREVTRAQGDDRAVWFNARTGPWFDVGYYEGIDRTLHASTWRESADGLSAVKIRQVFDPDQVIVPLYWRSDTLPFYSNYAIGLGITPEVVLGHEDLLRKLPYVEAAYETRRMQWLEADLEPNWRVDPETEIEAYALKHGASAVLSVIDHREDAGRATISADTVKLDLDPSRPVYVFVHALRDIREAWEALPEAERREVYRATGWGLDTAAKLFDVQVIEQPGERIELTLPTTQHILTMAVLSNSPARVFSVGGLRTNFQGTDVLGASVSAERIDDIMRLTASAPEGGARAIVVLPEGTTVGPDAGRRVLADTRMVIVPLPYGNSTIDLALQDAPPVVGPLTLEAPEEAAAGEALALRVPGATGIANVSVASEGVLLYAGELPVEDGAVALPVPEQAHAGTLQVGVGATVGGELRHATREVAVTGSYEPDLPPWRMRKEGPFGEVAEADVTARGLHVIGTGTESYDGYQRPQVAVAEPEALRSGGGIADAPVTRYGYGFGGLELERARVLKLKITNTFFDAWSFSRGMPSFHPQYTSTFAGLLVDYHTDDGYTKRVALGLGLLNPKRTIERPLWGTRTAPHEYVNLADAINEGREMTLAIDLARWAPEGWDGRVWLSAGAENVYPSRRVHAEILEASDSPEGFEITEGESMGDIYALREYTVVRAEQAPTVDGRLDDAVWQQNDPAHEFRLLGKIGQSAQDTQAWAAWDDEALYIAYRCPESEKEQPTLQTEKIWNRDAVDTAINPSGDRAVFAQIMVDAAGESEQFWHGLDGETVQWQYEHAVGEYDGGWTVELAVPWSEMGVEPSSGMEMTGNWVRYRPYPPVDEMQTWSPMPGPAINDPERFGVWTLE